MTQRDFLTMINKTLVNGSKSASFSISFIGDDFRISYNYYDNETRHWKNFAALGKTFIEARDAFVSQILPKL